MTTEATETKGRNNEDADVDEFVQSNIARFDHYISVADAKVAAVIALDGALIAGATLAGGGSPGDCLQTATYACSALSVLAAAVSLGFSARAAKPRLTSSGRSLMFFGDVAQTDASKYEAELKGHDVFNDRVEQSHYLARIAAAKHAQVAFAITALNWAILFFVLSVSLHFVGGLKS